MRELAYAVGDIHGCAHLLRELLTQVEDHAQGRAHDLIFLGDYIDKGPDTAATLALLMNLTNASGRVFFLKGNHEADLLAGRDNERALRRWLAMGGDRVLAEYGAASPDRLPAEVLAWIEGLLMFHEDSLRHYVHAGLDPAFPRDRQPDAARLTMRGDFLARDHDFGRHVMHGHTPQMSGAPDCRPFRTNIDTGAWVTGTLTAAILAADQSPPVGFLQTRG
jgi:serine/threonine protein phosphatase 1